VEITVVMEEGVVLRRGSLVLAPSEEKSTVVLVPPLRYQIFTNNTFAFYYTNLKFRVIDAHDDASLLIMLWGKVNIMRDIN
jgi:hypothetical protein